MSRDDGHWSERDALADLLAAERAVEPPPGSERRVLERVMSSVAVGVPTPPECSGLAEAAGAAEGGASASVGASSGAAGASTAGAAGAAGASVSVAAGGSALAVIVGGATVGALALGVWLALAPSDPIPSVAPTAVEVAPVEVTPEPPRVAVAPATRPPIEPPAAAIVEPIVEPPIVTPAVPVAPRPAAPPRAVRPQRRVARRAEPAKPNTRAVAPDPAPPEPPPVAAVTRPETPPDTPPDAPSPTPAPAVDDALRGELELLAEARDALAAGAPDAALRAVDEHARRHPQGRFDQERELLAIRALIAAGRPDAARTRAARFRVRFPTSLHRAAVDTLAPPMP